MKSDNARLAWDTILRKPRHEIPIWLINPMEWAMIDRGASSSIAPGVTWENLKALVEAFAHFRERGR
ncbi:MAG: hypothetical protein QGH15_04080 [Kiritimatiellia bacterium]|nr:hypothetical protein [Kiritimatiellia bacterium]